MSEQEKNGPDKPGGVAAPENEREVEAVAEPEKEPGAEAAAEREKAREEAGGVVDGQAGGAAAADTAGAGAGLEGGAELDALRAELDSLQAELVAAKDQSLRNSAEMQNIRRRAEKDVTHARLYALEKFARDLLPVIDSLERAVESAAGAPDAPAPAADAVVEGVALTLKSFVDVLKRFSVEQLNPLSEPFDPQFHEAISMVENKEVEPNTVLNVVQKGYALNGRLIRAAMVIVSRD